MLVKYSEIYLVELYTKAIKVRTLVRMVLFYICNWKLSHIVLKVYSQGQERSILLFSQSLSPESNLAPAEPLEQ